MPCFKFQISRPTFTFPISGYKYQYSQLMETLMGFEVGNLELDTFDLDWKPETWDFVFEAWELEQVIWNLDSESRSSEFATCKSQVRKCEV